MPNESYDSVKITYLNREKILEELNACAIRIRQDLPEVKRVLLFGSLVSGNYGPRSDADILLVLEDVSGRLIDRIPRYLKYFSAASIAVEVLPMTERELERRMSEGDPFICRVMGESEEIGN